MDDLLLILPAGVAVLVLVLILIASDGLGLRKIKAKSLRQYKSKGPGVADLLNYAAVIEDGIIVCKSGAFMASWLYSGDDLANATEEECDQIAGILNTALTALGSGWMIHVDAIRRAAPSYIGKGLSHFPDRVSAAIDEERRRYFEGLDTMYEGFYVLTVTWYPPLLVQQKFVDLMFDDESGQITPEGYHSKLLEQFRRDISTLESRLSSVFHLQRLRGQEHISEDGQLLIYDDFLAYLQFCVTGISQPMQLPPFPVHLDAVLGGQELFGGVVPRIGRKLIQTVSIDGFPLESCPGILTALTNLDVAYRWSNRFIFLDQHEAIGAINKYHRKWRQKQRGIIDVVLRTNKPPDQDAMEMTVDAEAAMTEVKGGLISAGYYTSTVVLMDEDREVLDDAAQKVQKLLFNLGFAARIETINTMEAWIGSLPGHGEENVRRPLINTLNLAHLLPTSSIWTGDDYCPCPMYPPDSPALLYGVAAGRTPFRLNLHVRDLGHTIILGPTGSGKSTALATLAAQFRRYKGMTIFAFDKGMSLYPLTSACGGRHFVVETGSGLNFCPLQFLATPEDIAWAQDWIESVLGVNGVSVDPAQRNEIQAALKSMAMTGGQTLTDFVAAVQDERIRQALKPYTIEGAMGELLDAAQDGLTVSTEEAAFFTFEVSSLLNMGEKWVFPVLLYLFRRIERSLKGQPAIIILDEAWILLGHPVFKDKVREWFKVLRKNNCALIMATQSISDALNSGIFDVIMESTASKIYLPNAQARTEETAATYRKMGLNKQQIEIIAGAIPKSDYYFVSERGARLFSFALGPLTLAITGASDADTVQHIQALARKHGPAWVDRYLADKGLSLEEFA